jgi:DNA-binding MarR family transcriptional regulator
MRDNQVAASESAVDLLLALAHSGKIAEARLDSALENSGLSLARWFVLQHLAQVGGSLPLGQLGERLACAKSNVTQLVDRLEADRLVERVHDAGDRRSVLAQLTPEGRRRYHDGLRALNAVEEELREEYSPEERRQLDRLLRRLGRHTG